MAFQRRKGANVPLIGVVCAGIRFEGMVMGCIRSDGWNATDEIGRLLINKKFLPQLHMVLLDGIAFGGFNRVNLSELSLRLQKPCIAMMRRMPNLHAVHNAIQHLSFPQRRLELLKRAGPIHQNPPFYFQVAGAEPHLIAQALVQLTDKGHVPEALRLAHFIGSAIGKGERSHSA